MYRPKMSWQTKLYVILLLIGFAFMEFPGVFFFQKVSDPFILGLPFIYGYIILWWFFMITVLFIAYKTNWGVKREDKKS